MVEKIRNILLIGETGSGKSSLANVITGTNKFKESGLSVSETKQVQTEEFNYEGINYRVIDTIGINDTADSIKEYLYNLVELSGFVKDGLNQILFVTKGDLGKKTKEVFNLFKEVIFDGDIINYTTIVGTWFVSFEDGSKVAQGKKRLLEKSENFKKTVERGKVIYINNPSIDSGRDEEEKELNKMIREKSKKILLEYLASCKVVYKPNSLNDLNEFIERKRIDGFIQYIKEKVLVKEKNHVLEQILDNWEKRLEASEREYQDSHDSQSSFSVDKGDFESIEQKIKESIEKKTTAGTKIVKTTFFSTQENSYAMVTSRKIYYANWLVIYKVLESENKIMIKELKRFPNSSPASGYLSKEVAYSKAKKRIERFENQDELAYLRSENEKLRKKLLESDQQTQIEISSK